MARTTAKAGHTVDNRTLAKLRKALQAAFNNHDANAYAGFFATDGDIRSPDGALVHGRPAIEKASAANFAGRFKNAKVAFLPGGTTRYLGASLALMDGAGDVTGGVSPDGREMPPYKFLSANCLVKRNGAWQVLTSRTWPANPTPGPAPAGGR